MLDAERHADLQTVLRYATNRSQSKLWTSLPGYVVDFDADTCTATIQIGVKTKVSKPDGTAEDSNIALLGKVPIMFPRGGGAALTFPINPGDEVLVVFASRCVDAWKQSGGVQVQSETRFHDLSDGFAIPGFMSQAKPLPSLSTTTTQLRSEDGATYVELDADGQAVSVVAPGGINLNGVTIDASGNVSSPATITASTDVVGGGKSLKNHVHSGVQSGGSNSGPPA